MINLTPHTALRFFSPEKFRQKEDTMKEIKPKCWIVIHPHTEARLCKDNKWREFAMFGTYPTCVKIFKSRGWAEKAAERFAINHEWKMVALGKGESMDASGRIFSKDGTHMLLRSCRTAFEETQGGLIERKTDGV